ncbi:hypothetical protein [Thalassomonas haliotis]|uniref:Natural product n=1 Tax=Thalassomonas haliotis TaxID=485448 RepID=A0ABY7VEI1_9GAMM|nr:hypothetical protein [Thalassomonas haliotis]WDE12124.1 hypothetical protein H3N35_01145 [Thalassomonas haliotis]
MKLKLNKKKLKNLSDDKKALPENMTPQVGGGYTTRPWTWYCEEPTNILMC